ncbi:MAG TPA: DUF1648 domain-containing protein [Pseudolysinimonas sp.]|nr:DUF1648 domain-containing protein [Pseudolysinimonas sp.]
MNRLTFRIALVGLILPLTLVAIGVGVLLAWLPAMPAEIATHWGFSGEPDAFGPAWTMPLMLAVVGVALPVTFTIIATRSMTPAGPTATHKVLLVSALFVGFFVTYAMLSSVALQRDGATGAQPIGAFIGIGAVVAFALAALGWLVLPRSVAGRSMREPGTSVPLAPGERVVWVGHARFSAGVLVALVATVVLATGGVAFAIGTTGSWWLVVVPVVLSLALLGTVSWRVRVDPSGLTVRAALGWPMYRVATADVVAAGVTDVVPLGEFGGYGIRLGLGRRLGIVTRGGEALEVQRRDGRAVIVTVDDAATAAGLLTAYAAKRG